MKETDRARRRKLAKQRKEKPHGAELKERKKSRKKRRSHGLVCCKRKKIEKRERRKTQK